MKLWAGRFSKEADERVNDFNSSIRFDSRMYAHDIKGSMAHAQMLGAQGIIPRADADAICDGLDSICGDLQSASATRVSACIRRARATIRLRWTCGFICATKRRPCARCF